MVRVDGFALSAGLRTEGMGLGDVILDLKEFDQRPQKGWPIDRICCITIKQYE